MDNQWLRVSFQYFINFILNINILNIVAPGKFKTLTSFDLDNPWSLMLFNMESPIITALWFFITYLHRDIIKYINIARLRFFFIADIARVLIYWGVLGFSNEFYC